MLKSVLRITLSAIFTILLTQNTSANDSDVVNCNRPWRIAILGSSTSFGTGATTYDSSWAGKFTAYVNRRNTQHEIHNFGIPGFTSYQNLCPTGFVPPAGRPAPDASFNITAALSMDPDALIINLPSNDVAYGYSIAEQKANFERAMHLADSANVPVWVTTTQPRNNMTSTQISDLTIMRDWIFTRFGDKAVDFWTGIANGDGSIVDFYDYDYVHVNNAGHDLLYKRIIAETILDSLCLRTTQTLVARAGNDISLSLPVTNAVLNGSGSLSSNGGIITGYQWLLVSGQGTAQIVSPASAVTTINNLSEGRYSFSLTVTDNAFNIRTDTVNVVVSSRILIDFGPDAIISPDALGNTWNNISDAQPGIKLQNAVTTGNAATNISLEVINRIDGTFNVSGPGTSTSNTLGALNDYPAPATNDFAFAEASATNGLWKIAGLETTKQYTIKFWGTRSVIDNRVIQVKRADEDTWQEYNATNNSNYNTSATFTFSGRSEMSFDIRVKAGSAFGHICLIDITRTTPAVTINIPPVAKANNVSVALPATSGTLDGSASGDDDGNITNYQWTQISGPVASTISYATSAITAVNNLVEGIYTFKLTVTDDSSAVANTLVTLTVSKRILFDFGPDATTGPDANGKYWNNVPDGLPGIKIPNAITTGNTASSIAFEIINRIDGSFNPAGPGTNTGNSVGVIGDYPSSATDDYVFAHPSEGNGLWKLSGLDSSKQYTIKFWGTRNVTDERVIQIKTADDTTWKEYEAANNVDYNNAAVFTLTGKSSVNFNIKVRNNSAFGHISLIDITVTNPYVDCTPAVSITSTQSAPVCSGTPISFTALATNGGSAPIYQWRKNGIDISGATAQTFTISTLMSRDTISCKLTANSNCGSGTIALSNSIIPSILQVVKIGLVSGPVDACPFIGSTNNATYYTEQIPNVSLYTWTMPVGATIISGQGTNTITVRFDSSFGTTGIISVIGGTCSNGIPGRIVVTKNIPAIPNVISGPVNACPFLGTTTQAIYSIAAVPNATSYLWTLPANMLLVSGQGTTSVNVRFNSTFTTSAINVKAVSSCQPSENRSLTITAAITPPPGTISGPSDICTYIGTGAATYKINKVAGASSYQWSVPTGATIASHPAGTGANDTVITVTYTSSFVSGSIISVRSVGCTVSDARAVTIFKPLPATPGPITVLANPCKYENYPPMGAFSIRKVPGATAHTWIVPAGSTVYRYNAGIDDTLAVIFPMNFTSGTISVTSSNGCGSNNISRSIAVSVVTPATLSLNLTGPTDPCPYTGTTTGATYKVNKIVGVTSYTWTVPTTGTTTIHPNGGGENDTIIIVKFTTAFTSGNISVKANTACGSSPAKTISLVRKLPGIPGNITTTLLSSCPTRKYKYSIAALPVNATSILWTVPAGATIVSGQGTTTLTVSYPPTRIISTIKAYGTNGCGKSLEKALSINLSACNGYRSIDNNIHENEILEAEAATLDVTIMPNPTHSDFKLIVKSTDKFTPVSLRISYINGRMIERKQGFLPGQLISVGGSYKKGIYVGELIQGEKRTVIKLIKL